MKMHRRSAAWSALIGATGIALAVIRQQQAANETRKLAGKVVLITGGSRGLGFAIASELAAFGAHLVLVARDPVELERARTRLVHSKRVFPTEILLKVADVTNSEEIRAAVSEATAHFGRIDVVINNAGIIMVGPVESQKLASFQQAMNVNFYGALKTTLAVLPQMLSRGEGAIVNIASIGGKVAFPHLLPYVASKFALAGWSQGLRAELTGKGIRVITVAPGVMRTGSHVQARYTGNSQEEYRWFAAAASFPGTATSARAAGKKIIRALALDVAEVSIGVHAIAASRLANIVPDLTAALLSLANDLLPHAPDSLDLNFWDDDQSRAGKEFRGSLPRPLELLGSKLIQQYNQAASGYESNQAEPIPSGVSSSPHSS